MTIAAPSRAGVWERRFWLIVVAITVVAAAIRLFYVLTDDRWLIGGDGLDYHLSALRLADGGGYTRALGQVGIADAHHPPGWLTVLGAVSWLGGRSLHAHQLVGVVCGLGVVVLAAMIGRRYLNAEAGLVAAVLAALYPGFWLLEGNMLSEPLALLLLGALFLLVADLRERPTIGRSAVVGAVGGLLALVRSEQLLVLALVVVPVLWSSRPLSRPERLKRIGVVGIACAAIVAPWAIYNATRFEDPVILSSGDGNTLLAGSCPPGSFQGERLGFWDNTCMRRVKLANLHADASKLNAIARRTAMDNLRENLDRLPAVIAARLGRTFAVFRPSQTVDLVARWMTVDTWLVWAWVGSFWLLLPLAVVGAVLARRRHLWTWPLVAPVAIALFETVVFFGEPRYHSMADLGLVVLAAYGIVRLLAWRPRPAPAAEAVAA